MSIDVHVCNLRFLKVLILHDSDMERKPFLFLLPQIAKERKSHFPLAPGAWIWHNQRAMKSTVLIAQTSSAHKIPMYLRRLKNTRP